MCKRERRAGVRGKNARSRKLYGGGGQKVNKVNTRLTKKHTYAVQKHSVFIEENDLMSEANSLLINRNGHEQKANS